MAVPARTLTDDDLEAPTDPARQRHQRQRIDHWDAVARNYHHQGPCRLRYHRRLEQIYRFLVPPGQRVLELGCGRGDLLASLRPAHGVGLDFSPEMIDQARERHPHLEFVEADAHELPFDRPFDVVVLSDLVNDLW